MKVFVCNDHDGYWPVPTASVIVAKDEEDAKVMLRKELESKGLKTEWFTLKELDVTKEQVEMLSDGDY